MRPIRPPAISLRRSAAASLAEAGRPNVPRKSEGGPWAISGAAVSPDLDFAATPAVVAAVAEANRLTYGHLFNPAFATEISLIDPLPHQRIAVYEHMLGQSPLRFLLADDAGAGKTIMTGLYLREVFARRLIKRVLVVPPAGLVGNWERELRTLFRLQFRIISGADARTDNPFVGPDSDRLIVSVDTLASERMFARLREAVASGSAPYDLVVFDEAHKLAADREQDFYVRKTDRYRLAETLVGLPPDGPRWELGWSATHVLMLTATPHMGKDFPYYCLWRLLAPDVLATFDAFRAFPEAQRRRHFIRRTKEEMVRFDGQPLYPQRQCCETQALPERSSSSSPSTATRPRFSFAGSKGSALPARSRWSMAGSTIASGRPKLICSAVRLTTAARTISSQPTPPAKELTFNSAGSWSTMTCLGTQRALSSGWGASTATDRSTIPSSSLI